MNRKNGTVSLQKSDTRTVRGYETNKSDVRKKYPETKNLKKLGEKKVWK